MKFAKHCLRQSGFSFAEGLAWIQTRALSRRKVDPGKILVLTAHTHHIEDYASIARENKIAYAAQHGYAFQCLTSGFDASRPPSWSKIPFIKQALRKYDWVFWTDADSLIMNRGVKLESLIDDHYDLHLTRAETPFPHVNCGQMLAGRSIFTTHFLNVVWRAKIFIDNPSWEQAAFNYFLINYRCARAKISDNRLFNSYGHVENDPHPYREGDFVIHFPGVKGKLEVMRHYARLSA